MTDYIKKLFDSKGIVKGIISWLSCIGSTLAICMVGYTHYLTKNVLSEKELSTLSTEFQVIQSNQKDLEKDYQTLLLTHEKAESDIHAMDVKYTSLVNKLKNTIDYQNVLREEVKENAEKKINTADFWRNINNILIRIRWLEDHDLVK